MSKGKRPSDNGKDGRDAKGKFAKGWKGGPGRKPGKRNEVLSQVLDKLVTPEKATKIVCVWLGLAEQGEPWAVKEFIDRCIGKSVQPIDVDGDIRFTLTEALRLLKDDIRAA